MRIGVSRAAAIALFFVAVAVAAGTAAPASAQTTGAVLQREQKPAYPEGLNKIHKQGNVLLAGRLDTSGRVQDIIPLVATNVGFVDPAVDAAKAWQFKPATRKGKPVDIAVNIGMRFRLQGDKRGDIPRAILGDLSVFPASASGTRSSPDGFPIHRGVDPRLRVEAALDIPPVAKAQQLDFRADALSPTGRRVNLWAGKVAAPAKAQTVPIVFSAPVGNDWEDGVWTIQTSLGDVPAGSGQFWLAGDPERFDFAAITARNAAASKNVPPAAVPAPAATPPKGAPAKPAPTARAKRA